MGPEQTRGQEVDERTDVWAFGCVLYEMLTGRPAFGGGTGSDRVAAILGREPDWTLLPRETPASVTRVLRRCLVKDAHNRVHDIADVRIEIDVALDRESDGGRSPTSVARLDRDRVAVAAWPRCGGIGDPADRGMASGAQRRRVSLQRAAASWSRLQERT